MIGVNAAQQPCDLIMVNSVEKAGLQLNLRPAVLRVREGRPRLSRHLCSQWDKLCQLGEVLGGGCGMEFVAGIVRPS